jgi:hypothetical protein
MARRKSRRNPWTSERPSNWSSMSKAQRKAWNRANWSSSGGGSSTPRSRSRVKVETGSSLWTPNDIALVKKWGSTFVDQDDDVIPGAVGDRLDTLINDNEGRFLKHAGVYGPSP